MIKVTDNNIVMTKGDTLILGVELYREDELDYEVKDTDTIRFALKEKYEDDEPLIVETIPTDTMILRVDSDKTKLLEPKKRYVYDVELTTEDGIVDTFISGKLMVTGEVL